MAFPHLQQELELADVGCQQRDVQKTLCDGLLGRVIVVAKIL